MSFIEWTDVFNDVFEDEPDDWCLTLVHRNDASQIRRFEGQGKMTRTVFARYVDMQECRSLVHHSFDRFHCGRCSNTWASAKAMLVLYYPRQGQPLGRVTLRFFGQECKKCQSRGVRFVEPELEIDAIQLTLEKLKERIGWDCYGRQRPKKLDMPDNRKRPMNGPHEKHLCEACQLGECEFTVVIKKVANLLPFARTENKENSICLARLHPRALPDSFRYAVMQPRWRVRTRANSNENGQLVFLYSDNNSRSKKQNKNNDSKSCVFTSGRVN